MSTQKIEKQRWIEYFDHLSSVTDKQLVTIEIAGLSIGDQTEVEDAPFDGISYDDGDDVITVQAGDIGHMIKQPGEVYVLEEDDGLKSIEVTDSEDNKHILMFKPA